MGIKSQRLLIQSHTEIPRPFPSTLKQVKKQEHKILGQTTLKYRASFFPPYFKLNFFLTH